MSDDDADPELVELLRQSMLRSSGDKSPVETTHVLKDAEYIYDHQTDVAIDMMGTINASRLIWQRMQESGGSNAQQNWDKNELHPKTKDEAALNFIFTMDVLNFSFWSELSEGDRFAISYKDQRWTGYSSLVAALQRALDEGIPITTPSFWLNEADLDEEKMAHIFRSMTEDMMPLLTERLNLLREAGHVLQESFDGSVAQLMDAANHSVVSLVNLLVDHFPSFRDVAEFEGRKVRFLKRAQIFAADVWAAFGGESYGKFTDIDKLTMFPDYRVPQILHTLGCMSYSPPLDSHMRRLQPLPSGQTWEVSIRGCTIWCVELIRRRIVKENPEAQVNAVWIDFFLYDLAKEQEKSGHEAIPHHRTRSIWY